MIGLGQLNRPRIFGEWPDRRQRYVPVDPVPPRNNIKNNQSIRAEQALHQSLMLILNVKKFTQKKDQIVERCNDFIQKSSSHKRQLEKLTQQSGDPYDNNKYRDNLRQYYKHIRQQMNFLHSTKFFLMSNLPNYDNKSAKMRQQITQFEKVRQQLTKKIEYTEAIRKILQQSLTMYELPQNQKPKSTILPNTSYYPQYNFQLSLELMLKQISEQKLIQLHYLMQYEIKIVEKHLSQFNANIKDDKDSYSVYEAIYDSMNLMNFQQDEMKKDQQDMGNQFMNLNVLTAPNIVPFSSNALNILLKNQKVYDSNYQLLARYNAETNLKEYSERRKDYSERLTKFKRALNRWKQEQQIASFLYNRQQIYTGYGKLLNIADRTTNPVDIRNDKQLLKKAYYQCMSFQIPKNLTNIANYRQQITQNMKNLLQNKSFPKDRFNSEPARVPSLSEHEYRKYLNLFVQLQSIAHKDKAVFLLNQINSIQAMRYQLSKINPQTSMSRYYTICLNYCYYIAQHVKKNMDVQYKSDVELNRRQRWTNLPRGLEILLFHYSIDVGLKTYSQQYIHESFQESMATLKAKIQTQLSYSYNSTLNSEDGLQFPKKHLSLPLVDTQMFFIKFLRKISKFGDSIKKNLMDYYWSIPKKFIVSSYQSNSPSSINLSIQKKDFFKFRILSYLAIKGSQLKISNLLQLIEYYLDYMEKFSSNNWSVEEIFLQVVKQKIFIQFLANNAQLRRMNIGGLIYGLQLINEATILMFETNLFLQPQNIKEWTNQVHNQVQTEQYFQYGLKIHKQWLELESSAKNNRVMEQNNQILRNVNRIVELMKKSPIIIVTKQSLPSVQAVVGFRSKVSKLKIIRQINTDGLNLVPPSQSQGMKFKGAVYLRVMNLLEIYQNINNKFAPSDIMMIRDNNNKFLYLQELRSIGESQLNQMMNELNVIMKIYRSQKNDEVNYKSKNILFETIIKKLLNLKQKQSP